MREATHTRVSHWDSLRNPTDIEDHAGLCASLPRFMSGIVWKKTHATSPLRPRAPGTVAVLLNCHISW